MQMAKALATETTLALHTDTTRSLALGSLSRQEIPIPALRMPMVSRLLGGSSTQYCS